MATADWRCLSYQIITSFRDVIHGTHNALRRDIAYRKATAHGRKQKGAWVITGLGHGLINWCCEWRCPLNPRKQTFARQSKKVCL